jgi:bifunctional enzyme CysN/CysC
VAPSEKVRNRARDVIGKERFLVVHLSAPVAVCRQRDTAGQYPLADSGEIANFPGVSADYEVPASPDLVLPTHEWPVEKCVEKIVELLAERGLIS